MLAKYPLNARLVAFSSVHLTSLLGILSLWDVADTIYFFLFFTLYLAGIYMDIKGLYPVRRLFLNLLSVVLIVYFLSFLSLEDLLRPFAHVVLLLLAVKSLEEKRARDLYQMLLLSLFALSISTAYNLSLSFLGFFLLHSFFGVSSLFFVNLYKNAGERRLSSSDLKQYMLASFTLFSLVALLTLPFFFLLPRTQTPLFELFQRGGGLRTGLADSVSLGKVGEIQEDNTVVFRVYGLPQDIKDPYWRVVVFGNYIKDTWHRIKEDRFPIPQKPGELVYTLVLDPSFDNYLPALDYPHSILKIEGINANAYMATGNVLRLDKEISRSIKVVLSSSKEPLILEDPSPYLQLPSDISPNLRKLAEELSKDARNEEEKLKRVVAHFSKGYEYTLKLEKYEGNPLDYFLFVSKRGNCEYYASATALLLRLMGIPARVVGGYRGALWNQYGGYYIVTNSMAHVWVEAYVNGRWLRIDTTPPYTAPALRRISSIALIRDAIVSFWYSQIVGYSSEKQIRLFKNIGKGFKSSLKPEKIREKLLQMVQLISFPLFAFLALYLFLRLRKTPENLYLRTKRLLRSEGIIKNQVLPEEILSACKDKEYYKLVKFILSIYQRHKYSPYRVYPDEVREGYRALARLREVIRNSRHS